MKKIKIIVVLLSVVLIIFAMMFNVNLLLNKKYVVDEISYTRKQEGLIGIQEIVSQDYIYMLYFNLFYILIFVGMIVLFFKKSKNIR